MNSLTVNEIIKAQEICFLRQSREDCDYCKECPIFEEKLSQNCQEYLAENTIKKLNELVELLDDSVNHHYYDTLESLQEINIELTNKLDSIKEIIEERKVD